MGSSLHPAAVTGVAPVGLVLVVVGAPLVMVLAPGSVTTGLLLAGLAGVLLTGRASGGHGRSRLDLVIGVGVLVVLAALASVLSAGPEPDSLVEVGRFLLIPLGFLAMRRVAGHDLGPALWLSSVVGAIAAGGAALAVLGFANVGRPTSFVNPIHFGELALVLGFLATVTRGLAGGDRRVVRRVTLVAVAAAVTASVLAQSRGSWLALPVIVAVALVHHRRSGDRRTLRYAAVLVVVVVPVMIVAGTVNGRAAARALDRGIDQTIDYVVHDGAGGAGETSVGARLEMWRSAVAGFRAHPMLGVGWGHMDDRFAEDVVAGVRAERIADHRHPHNQYVSHLGSGGLVGLVSLLALFAVPAGVCARAWCGSHPQARALGGGGLVVVGGFAVFAMTDSVLESASPLVFFVLVLGAIIGQLDRLEGEQVFAYGGGHGLEQPAGAVEGARAHPVGSAAHGPARRSVGRRRR